MKKSIIAVAVAAGVLVIAPKFIGSMVETERQKAIAELNEASNGEITLTTTEHNQSWFGADVKYDLTFSSEEMGITDLTIKVEEDISFGPVIFSEQGMQLGLGYANAKFNAAELELEDEVNKFLDEKLHITALLGFDKSITTFVGVDKVDYNDGENSLVSEPLSAQFSIVDNKSIEGSFSWAGFELKGMEGHVVVDAIDMSTNQTVLSGNYLDGSAILVGDAQVSVAEINVFNGESKIFSLEKGQVSSDVSVDNDLLALALNYNANVISESGEYYQKPNLALKIDNIDVKALQELNTTMAEMSANTGQQTDPNQLLASLSGIVDQVLAKKPNLKIDDLSVETEQGKIATQINLNINEDLFDTTNLNAMGLIPALVANAKGKVPAEFLSKFGLTPMVDGFVEQGYFTRQESDIAFDAKYVESQLTLNGKVFQM